MLIELKNGETFNGDLVNCDSWMNLTLSNVIQLNATGDSFMKVPEVYIRGIHIKYLRLPDEIMDHAKEQSMLIMEQRNRNQKRRGGHNNHNGNFGGNRRGGFQNRNGFNRRYNNQGQGNFNQGNRSNTNTNSNNSLH